MDHIGHVAQAAAPDSAASNGTDAHQDEKSGTPTIILFIFGTCAIGALTRTMFKRVPLPYTVILLIIGGLYGLLAHEVQEVADYATITDLDPHVILHVFLPVLIFESAFAMDVHTFMKSGFQMVTLAIPGFIFATVLTGIFALFALNYEHWTWPIAIMFGAIISATDPVAVVALLKEVGASKTLGVLIEGESLLNDGAAIVVFNVCAKIAIGNSQTAMDVFVYFVRVTLGGPLFGFIMAKGTTFWLVKIYNDALSEITITLASTYITFYIGEVFLQVSGVLAVVALGITINLERTSISPEVEAFLHRFWEMLAYLANTLIFVIVGVVITKTASQSTNIKDWGLMVALYCAISVIRPVTILLFSPILRRMGYGLKWRDGVVMAWSGLRGAVGLALALVVQHEGFLNDVKAQILLHAAGIVLLTLTVNGTTIGKLLELLGMTEISAAKRMAMASAVRTLNDVRQKSFNIFKHDRFLADADWITVEEAVKIKDPYNTLQEEAELDDLADIPSIEEKTECKDCTDDKGCQIHDDEESPELMNQLRNEARLRLLKAQKASFVRQFAYGMLSREAVRKLIECVDIAMDTTGKFIDIDEVKKAWQIGGIYASLKRRLEKWRSQKLDTEELPPPANKCLLFSYRVVMHNIFEVFIYVVIIVNVATLTWQMVAESQLCAARFDEIYGNSFYIINMVFIAIYTMEAVLKILGMGPVPYIRSNWNKFDFLILLISGIDVVLDLTIFKDSSSSTATDCADGSDEGTVSNFNPSVLRVARIVRLLRILRSLRLVRGLIPQVIGVLNGQINKQIRYGYDVGKGYVMAEEEVTNFVSNLVDKEAIRAEMRGLVSQGRLTILKELGMLQREHPGIAVSVKTQQAARRILNNIRQKIEELSAEGALDSGEVNKLYKMLETRMKKLMTIPAVIPPPPPESVLRNLEWANQDPNLMEYLNQHSRLVTMMDGEVVMTAGESGDGIYVIVSGLVRVESFVEDNTDLERLLSDQDYIRDISTRASNLLKISDLDVDDTSRRSSRVAMPKPAQSSQVVDYLGAGSILGEMSLLTDQPRHATVTCASAVELYQIPFDIIMPAIALDNNVPSLEYRLWRVCAVRVASSVLRNHFAYKHWTVDRLKLYLEKSLIFLHKQAEDEEFTSPTFELNNLYMSDVVLVLGDVEFGSNRERMVGPCYVNNTIKRLYLVDSPKHVILVVPRGSYKNMVLGLNSGPQRAPSSQDLGMRSSLCLKHSSMRRMSLTSSIESSRSLAKKSSTRLGNLARLSGMKLRKRSSHSVGAGSKTSSSTKVAKEEAAPHQVQDSPHTVVEMSKVTPQGSMAADQEEATSKTDQEKENGSSAAE